MTLTRSISFEIKIKLLLQIMRGGYTLNQMAEEKQKIRFSQCYINMEKATTEAYRQKLRKNEAVINDMGTLLEVIPEPLSSSPAQS